MRHRASGLRLSSSLVFVLLLMFYLSQNMGCSIHISPLTSLPFLYTFNCNSVAFSFSSLLYSHWLYSPHLSFSSSSAPIISEKSSPPTRRCPTWGKRERGRKD
ncbi:hypothetical protein GOODEAATRI_009466 [Goodea atripinnis]|uniref:Secreted protein n=1 Tax=Goodea atripinnis TaxID=208336 RepID=A0ABV0NTI8_9TELE